MNFKWIQRDINRKWRNEERRDKMCFVFLVCCFVVFFFPPRSWLHSWLGVLAFTIPCGAGTECHNVRGQVRGLHSEPHCVFLRHWKSASHPFSLLHCTLVEFLLQHPLTRRPPSGKNSWSLATFHNPFYHAALTWPCHDGRWGIGCPCLPFFFQPLLCQDWFYLLR